MLKKHFFRTSASLFLCIFLLLLTLSPHPRERVLSAIPSAVAQTVTPLPGDYACILTDDVYLYTDANGKKGLFLLPKTYYVRLIDYQPDFCRVEYQRNESNALRIAGYVRTEQLTFVDYVPLRPYLYYVFDVTYSIENTNPADSSFLTQITISCIYYGDYYVGSETYCYVLRGEEFGYIPKPDHIRFENNDEYADYLASKQPISSEKPSNGSPVDVPPMQIALLVVICLLVPVLAALILKPPNLPSYEPEE